MTQLTTSELTWNTKDGRRIRIKDMDNDHLQKALVIAQRGEFNLWSKIEVFENLRDAIEAEAATRELKLLDVDQIEPSNRYGHYFSSRSKRKNEVKNNQL